MQLFVPGRYRTTQWTCSLCVYTIWSLWQILKGLLCSLVCNLKKNILKCFKSEISKNVPIKFLYGTSDVILLRLHQGMECINGNSDIITYVRFTEVQTCPPCYIHLGQRKLDNLFNWFFSAPSFVVASRFCFFFGPPRNQPERKTKKSFYFISPFSSFPFLEKN